MSPSKSIIMIFLEFGPFPHTISAATNLLKVFAIYFLNYCYFFPTCSLCRPLCYLHDFYQMVFHKAHSIRIIPLLKDKGNHVV